MQSADVVLTAIRMCGSERKPLERIYRQLFNRELYLAAYGKISRNQGATTPGTTSETIDGMSLAKIDAVISLLRQERYRWPPVRRVSIAKKGSTKTRPLGIPTWTDKLVQEVIRMILEAYYEPQFSDHSHGFRPKRGVSTAIHEIRQTWHGTVWFIEGDIKGCFDHIDHDILLEILAASIHDGRFLNLIKGALTAGYLEDWTYHPTLSGTPQGGIVSPILANIYLDRLDRFVEETLIPASTRGDRRNWNPAYMEARNRAAQCRRAKQWDQAHQYGKRQRTLPSVDTHDPTYRRLRYIRYADDYLLGFAGPRQEAEAIKQQLATFLRDKLKLEQSEEKTVITHGRTGAASFLGFELTVQDCDTKRTNGRRSVNADICFRIPRGVVTDRCGPFMRNGKPMHLQQMVNDSEYDTVVRFQAEYRGLVNYYRVANNLGVLATLKWAMQGSLVKTIAAKRKIHVSQVYKRFQRTIETADGPRKVLQVTVEREGKPPLVATWGNVALKRDRTAVIHEPPPGPPPTRQWSKRAQIVERLLAERCELCGATGSVEAHHIRHLRTLQQKGRREKPLWVQIMAARRRKSLIVCLACHHKIHRGEAAGPLRISDTGEPDDAKVSRPVRRGADGKVPA